MTVSPPAGPSRGNGTPGGAEPTAGLSPVVTVALLLGTTALYTVGDLMHANAAAALSYDLAAPHAVGQYQGVTGLTAGSARALGPLLAPLRVDGPRVGWLLAAAGFAVTGLATPALTRWAMRRPDAAATP
jgi:hypothetical protein